MTATANGVTVFFDTDLSEELVAEGLAREFVNRVQRMRKEADFHVSDRIKVNYQAPDKVRTALETNNDFVMEETLTIELMAQETPSFEAEITQKHDLEGLSVEISLAKATSV